MAEDLNETQRSCRRFPTLPDRRGGEPLSDMDAFLLRDMAFSCSSEFYLLQHQKGMKASRFLFFPGCQLSAALPREVEKTYLFLTKHLQGGVGVLLQCCGAPAEWAGCTAEAEDVRRRIRADWEKIGRPAVIAGCPRCLAMFRSHMPEIPVRFISDILSGLPMAETGGYAAECQSAAGWKAMAYHDPCVTRDDPLVQDSSRHILETVGIRISELRQSRTDARCCGCGGSDYHTDRDLALSRAAERLAESALPFATSCSNCRDLFREAGKAAYHILELIWPCAKADGGIELWDLSGRREARRRLRRSIAMHGCGTGHAASDVRRPLLVIPDELRKVMHEEMIYADDIADAIICAENSGRRIGLGTGGRLAFGYRPGNRTCWIEYTRDKGRYVIHDCYSHRTRIDGVAEDCRACCGHEEDDGRETPIGGRHSAEESRMTETEDPVEAGLCCTSCKVPLRDTAIRVCRAGDRAAFNVPACPVCGQVYVSPDLARGALRELEGPAENGCLPASC